MDKYSSHTNTTAVVGPVSLFIVVTCFMAIAVLTYFPHTNSSIEQLMTWWWFRVAFLIMLLVLAVNVCNTCPTQPQQSSVGTMVVLFLAIGYVASSNVSNVRRAAAVE